MACQHEQFSAEVNVHRLDDPGKPLAFFADITVRCCQCREPWVRLKASFRGPYIVSPAEYERLRTLGCDMKHFVVSTPLPEKTDDL